MDILLVAPQPFFTVRGTPLAVRELALTFVSLGHTVDVLTYHLGSDIAAPGLRIYRTRLFSRRIRAIPPGFSIGKLLLDLILVPKAIRLILTRRYDVVHCVEESALFLFPVRWLSRALFVYDMDSDIPAQMTESGHLKNLVEHRVARIIERAALARSDAVVTICPVFTDRVRGLFPGKAVFQIEDVSVTEEPAPPAPPPGPRTILYTGNFEEYQGVELLLNAFMRIRDTHPDARLVIVGGEEDEVRALAGRYADPRIVFAGKKPPSEIPGAMSGASILASPRACGENTPYKIYSYLAAGKPILATDIVSHSQVLTDGVHALLMPPTEAGIAEGLRRLLDDPAMASALGRNARKLFEERYSRARYREKVAALADYLEAKSNRTR